MEVDRADNVGTRQCILQFANIAFPYISMVSAKTNNSIHSSSALEMFTSMIDQFNFVCIATKCREPCNACEQCKYALEQFSKILLGVKTGNFLHVITDIQLINN
ncbi:unnamed protein product [Onchocerca flexuosa]|uniref:Zinc finger BED domain-containing protein 5 n=1 Tax=Onchocerca flexuosa TaxID=387005 RepID=A0A183HHD7_9BILA|nr:unnamed protein product [Onchocerca flexuosa]